MGAGFVVAFVILLVALLFSGIALGGAIGTRIFKVPSSAATWPGFTAVGLTVILVVVTLRIGGPFLELWWIAFCLALHLSLQSWAIARIGAVRHRILVTISLTVAPWLFVVFVVGALVMTRLAFR